MSCRISKYKSLFKLQRYYLSSNLQEQVHQQFSWISALPLKVQITDVGPRDGLQNESCNNNIIPTDIKIELINKLKESGMKKIECGSFVSPKAVPQMANSDQVFNALNWNRNQDENMTYVALIMNEKGLERAVNCNVNEIIYVLSASNTFALTNMNCTRDKSYNGLKNVLQMICDNNINIKVRVAIACALGCPYEGYIQPSQVVQLIKQLSNDFNLEGHHRQIEDIFFCDTIGIATTHTTYKLLDNVLNECNVYGVSVNMFGVHFHDTYGQAVANILTSMYFGINIIESSIAGLGGCPFAKGATGNVSTEDVIYLLNDLKIETNVDLIKLLDASYFITDYLNIKSHSKVANAKRYNESYDFH
eukprot:294698_1